jgi:hypothetical protein
MTPFILACLLTLTAPSKVDNAQAATSDHLGTGIVRISAPAKTFGGTGQWVLRSGTHTVIRGNRVYAPKRLNLYQNATGSAVGHDLAMVIGATVATFVTPVVTLGAQLDVAYRLHGAAAVQVGPALGYAWHVMPALTFYPTVALLYDHVKASHSESDMPVKQSYQVHQLTLDLSPALAIHLTEHLSLQVGIRIQQSLLNTVYARTTQAAGTLAVHGPGSLSTTYGISFGLLGWL